MPKRIICVGIQMPGLEFFAYTSEQSLLDAEIVVFQPNITYLLSDNFHGMPYCQDEGISLKLNTSTKHWRHELVVALKSGKTIFVVLNKYVEFYTTGLKRHNNYECLPIEFSEIMPRDGSGVKFLNDPVFSGLWNTCKDYMVFESYFTTKSGKPLFTTNTGDKTIGCVAPTADNGHLIILPQFHFPDEFIEVMGNQQHWTEDAFRFGKKLASLMVEIDAVLAGSSDAIPQPDWVNNDQYKLSSEAGLLSDIESLSSKIETLSDERSGKDRQLSEIQSLKLLLYGTGTPLEKAVIEALELLGYQAENYNDGILELDQVIISPEGERLIGETEGKDKSQVGIDKLRQLMENIQTDAERDDVTEVATGVLFGNGFRTQIPGEREVQFTDKCLKSAEKRSVVLMQTSDLFLVAQYLHVSQNQEYAANCREAIKNSEGKIVVFPSAPETIRGQAEDIANQQGD